MDDLFTVEFKTSPSRDAKKEAPSNRPITVKNEKTVSPFPFLGDLEEAILQESEFSERLIIHLEDIRDALALEDYPKVISTLDLIEELFDLELY